MNNLVWQEVCKRVWNTRGPERALIMYLRLVRASGIPYVFALLPNAVIPSCPSPRCTRFLNMFSATSMLPNLHMVSEARMQFW